MRGKGEQHEESECDDDQTRADDACDGPERRRVCGQGGELGVQGPVRANRAPGFA